MCGNGCISLPAGRVLLSLHKQKKEHTTYVTRGRSLGAVFFVCLIKEVSELSMTKKKALENSAIYKQKKEHKT